MTIIEDYVSSRSEIKLYLDSALSETFEKQKVNTSLVDEVKSLILSQDICLVSHYYVDPLIQKITEDTGGFVGDSLEMARFGASRDSSNLIVCGVSFMGETAKILSPEKLVWMPTLEATCSLDLGCSEKEFKKFCDSNPGRTVVVYANTSAAVKAMADWVVTSSMAVDLVEYLTTRNESIIWAPDRYLGRYVKNLTGADMLIWDGACVVHEEFRINDLEQIKKLWPEAGLLVHPESPEEMIQVADAVGSTSQLILAAEKLPHNTFIVATDKGIFYKMQQKVPSKRLIAAPTRGEGGTCQSCAHCPWMSMNNLDRLKNLLINWPIYCQVKVNSELARKALIPLQRMLNF